MLDFSLVFAKRGFASFTFELSATTSQSITGLSAPLYSCPRLPSALPILLDAYQSPMELWEMQLMMQLQDGTTGVTTFAPTRIYACYEAIDQINIWSEAAQGHSRYA